MGYSFNAFFNRTIHIEAMSVILKVDEKVQAILSMLPTNYTEDGFLKLFRKEHPKDYEKCIARFLKEERKTKPGRRHPMQHPDKHIIAVLHSYLSRNKNNQKE